MNTYYKEGIRLVFVPLVLSCVIIMASAVAQPIPAQQPAPSSVFQAVPELPYKVVPNFFHAPAGKGSGEASIVVQGWQHELRALTWQPGGGGRE